MLYKEGIAKGVGSSLRQNSLSFLDCLQCCALLVVKMQGKLLGISFHLNAINKEAEHMFRDLIRTTCALGGTRLYFKAHYRD